MVWFIFWDFLHGSDDGFNVFVLQIRFYYLSLFINLPTKTRQCLHTYRLYLLLLILQELQINRKQLSPNSLLRQVLRKVAQRLTNCIPHPPFHLSLISLLNKHHKIVDQALVPEDFDDPQRTFNGFDFDWVPFVLHEDLVKGVNVFFDGLLGD